MSEPLTNAELDLLLQGARWEGPRHDERYEMFLEQRSGLLFLMVVGKVLQPVPDEFGARLREIFSRLSEPKVVVDLSRCGYLASSAIGFLVDFFNVSTADGVRVVMLKPNDRVRAIIDLLGLTHFFTLVDNEQAAITKLNAPA